METQLRVLVIPDELKSKLVIAEFKMSKIVEDGEILKRKQIENSILLNKKNDIKENEMAIVRLTQELETRKSNTTKLKTELEQCIVNRDKLLKELDTKIINN